MNRYDLSLTVPKRADLDPLADHHLRRPDDEGRPPDRKLAAVAVCLFWEGAPDGGQELRRALTESSIPYLGHEFDTVEQAGSYLASANGVEAEAMCAYGEIVVAVDDATGEPQTGSLARAKAFVAKRREAVVAIREYGRR